MGKSIFLYNKNTVFIDVSEPVRLAEHRKTILTEKGELLIWQDSCNPYSLKQLDFSNKSLTEIRKSILQLRFPMLITSAEKALQPEVLTFLRNLLQDGFSVIIFCNPDESRIYNMLKTSKEYEYFEFDLDIDPIYLS